MGRSRDRSCASRAFLLLWMPVAWSVRVASNPFKGAGEVGISVGGGGGGIEPPNFWGGVWEKGSIDMDHYLHWGPLALGTDRPPPPPLPPSIFGGGPVNCPFFLEGGGSVKGFCCPPSPRPPQEPLAKYFLFEVKLCLLGRRPPEGGCRHHAHPYPLSPTFVRMPHYPHPPMASPPKFAPLPVGPTGTVVPRACLFRSYCQVWSERWLSNPPPVFPD